MRRKAKYKPYEEARSFAVSLQLKNWREWLEYCKTGKKPEDIPATPYYAYKDSGWIDCGEWLGTNNKSTGQREYRPYEEARTFAAGLGLKTMKEWEAYCKTGKKPEDIPAFPNATYRHTGWKDWGEWLGTGRIANTKKAFLPYEEAKALVTTLGLKNIKEWTAYCRSGMKPENIPVSPYLTYKHSGWKGYGEWLGTNNVAKKLMVFRPYEEAKSFVMGLGLKNIKDWNGYCRSGEKPKDIPTCPDLTYKHTGWRSWGEWLGTNRVSNGLRKFRTYDEARDFVVALQLKSWREWVAYSKSGNRPKDIPACPEITYKNKGWENFIEWLGTGNVESGKKEFRSFEEARAFARMLKLKNQKQWIAYCSSGSKPADIPSNPFTTYKGKGWMGYGDWLREK